MSKPLVFMMGRSPVFVPVDREYARNHLWAVAEEAGYRLGFSAYAVKLLGELHCLRWSVTQGATIETGQAIGYVEASKATSDIYAPFSGVVAEIHFRATADPSLVNSYPYDRGWLMTVAGASGTLFAPEQYLAYLASTWPLAQRLLKGQSARKL